MLRRRIQPARPHPHLLWGLFTADVQHIQSAGPKRVSHMQQQSRLADSRFATQQHERPFDQPTAQHKIELGDCLHTMRVGCADCIQRHD